jgi:hypothetical protein
VVFPGTVANYGTGSFTIEMAFRPSSINGIHYLVSKNSGSFPNWGVYLSGSGGSGKLWATYNISAAISCSVSSSTTFVTGSNYFVDVQLQPGLSGSIIYNNGGIETGNLGNGGGSLTTTGSFLLGNIAPSSSQAYSGSLFFTRVYLTEALTTAYYNYNTSKTRLQINLKPPLLFRALIIGGGGAGGSRFGGGGGGAGGFIDSLIPLISTTYTIQVGEGGIAAGFSPENQPSTNGLNSSISNTVIAYGGGRGGNAGIAPGSGGSGGGSYTTVLGLGRLNQGFNGGTGLFAAGGGGGGAAGIGSNTPGIYVGGNGGPGRASDISGVLTYYAGGGGGGRSGIGGIGGGGNGANSTGQSGSVNTGGGGGASENGGAGNGGSGIVIIRYPGTPIATGGTITSVGGDTIHTFTATGSHTFTVF